MTTNNIYTNSPNPIAINRINYDCKLIDDTKDVLDSEGFTSIFHGMKVKIFQHTTTNF